MSRLVIAIGTILIPVTAAAHLGHAAHGQGDLLHYFTDPYHVSLTGAVVLLALAIRRFRQRRALVPANDR